jgi:geranylgeranyl transferase type-2 subunit beta
MSYLGNLTLRLAAGAMRLPEAVLRRHAQSLSSAQNADGGYSGREGPSDLYYTGFALRGLALCGALTDEIASRAAAYLGARIGDPLASVDFLSLVASAVLLEAATGKDVFAAAGLDRKQTVARVTADFHRGDGGYAKTQRSGQSSTYHTFLTAACLQLTDAGIDQPAAMEQLIRSRQRPDGGFVELEGLDHSGTNPTAAAVGVLRLLDAMDQPTRIRIASFLASMRTAEGGLRAHTRIPVADLLSTFAGLVALADLDALATIDAAAARDYCRSLELTQGGFRGGAWDNCADVEYTFYGLGVLALLGTH